MKIYTNFCDIATHAYGNSKKISLMEMLLLDNLHAIKCIHLITVKLSLSQSLTIKILSHYQVYCHRLL